MDDDTTKEVLALYVLLDYDPVDFLDAIASASSEVLSQLHKALTAKSENQNESNAKINAIGADMVLKELNSRAPKRRGTLDW